MEGLNSSLESLTSASIRARILVGAAASHPLPCRGQAVLHRRTLASGAKPCSTKKSLPHQSIT